MLCLVSLVGRDSCYELITRLEESYRLCVCPTVYDLKTSSVRQPRSTLGC
jgi:hypothetical protein